MLEYEPVILLRPPRYQQETCFLDAYYENEELQLACHCEQREFIPLTKGYRIRGTEELKRSKRGLRGIRLSEIEESTQEISDDTLAETRRLAAVKEVPLCKFWKRGRCQKANCEYRHSLTEFETATTRDDGELKSRRHEIFADWILATFPNLENGVLDVAGGGGRVAWALWRKRGLRTAVLDPRRKTLKRRDRKEIAKSAVPPPLHISQILDASFAKENAEFLASFSLIVGCHPDEATDAIMDTALKFGTHVALVPCCVFADLFKHRRRKAGCLELPVMTYRDLCEYLLAKDPNLQKATLPFAGRNLVIYRQTPSLPRPELELVSTRDFVVASEKGYIDRERRRKAAHDGIE